MVPISVVVITFNEEKNIGRCLDSVRDVADDIVVLDSFSTDRTKEIAEEKGARFFEHVFDGHVEQKNRAITYAKHPHVLSLDADEALNDKLKDEIIRAKKKFSTDGYYFNRLTNYCGKWVRHSGWYPDRKLRLWDSRKGQWKGINPHDRYEMEPGSKTEHLKGDLLHYSFYSIEQHIDTINKFSTIAAKMQIKQGKKFSWFKLLISPLWKFIRSYFFQGGILDGAYGFIICMNSAHATFVKYTKVKLLTEQARDDKKST